MKEAKNKRFSISSVFAWLLFFVAFFTTASVIFSSFTGDQNGKEIFGYKFLIVKSDSMKKPDEDSTEKVYFNSGDLIIIKSIEKVSAINNGDVITFTSFNSDSYGKTVTHKIREIKYSSNGEVTGYVTYGVYTGVDDSVVVKPENIIGVYAGKIPFVGEVFNFIKTPKGYFTSILLPCMFLIIFFSLRVGRRYERKNTSTPLAEQIEKLTERVTVLENLIKAKPSETLPILLDCATNKTPSLLSGARVKVSFAQRMLGLEEYKQDYFNLLHNKLLSYKKVNSRISFRCVSYRIGRKLIAKITVRGKTLKLHLALNVADFNEKAYFQQDLSSIKSYVEVPFTVKVKSNRGRKNALKLIDALALSCVLIKNDRYIPCDGIKKLSEYLKQNIRTDNIDEAVVTEFEKEPQFVFGMSNKVSFAKRILGLEEYKFEYFSLLHNELLSYKKVSSRISFRCVSYRIGRKLIAKMTVRGKTLKLHLALNVADFNEKAYFQQDLSSIKAYAEVPFTIKVKSNRGSKNALKLVGELAQKLGLIKNDKYIFCNAEKELSEYCECVKS